ncbi:MAG: ABC transporter substrate-binding protein [Chloroflexi bacterium OLB13]|nr:MAG: ABC transporter substrate-binding protein [Chloroflexi bacterium OLB13]
MNRLVLVIVFLLAVLPASAQQAPLTLVTYDSFSISEDVLASFTDQTGIEVEIVRLADAGAMVNQAILTKNNPLGDVLYGIDSTF